MVEKEIEEKLEKKFEKGSLIDISDISQGISLKMLSEEMEIKELTNLSKNLFKFIKNSRNKSKDSSYV